MSHEHAVLLVADGLFFRSKLASVVERHGGRPVRTGPASLAVVEVSGTERINLVRGLVADGARVLAFGSHVDAAVLRDARAAGADAVPNSRVEAALTDLLTVEWGGASRGA